MSSDAAVFALRAGGALHFVQLPAMVAMGVLLCQHDALAQVSKPLQRVLAVLAGGVVLAVFSGGVLSLMLPAPWLRSGFGSAYASSWCVFWAYRWAAQSTQYRPLVPRRYLWAHRALLGVFVLKTASFAVAAIAPWLGRGSADDWVCVSSAQPVTEWP